MSLSLVENLRITHNINTQDVKYSKFRILNTAENTAHKNVLISVLDNENFDFKIIQSETLVNESEWDNCSNEITIDQINPKQIIDFVLRTQVNGNTQPNIYDCQFSINSIEVIY
ncbi:hypothetical protein UFOVP724_17 [uncultured Caudovirales phage]|jgi:hypothetical protein|uniref:Uncharacterized protein n=1 Tax=uncultured Caudovirales phage TaxID=2100421 RepID=A0A6J5NJ98_9CAUD|nr:hypothetical protein UFOVP724_17 [uncultured Caudovirales phage]